MLRHILNDSHSLAKTYFNLIDKTNGIKHLINWDIIDMDTVYNNYTDKFNTTRVLGGSVFNKMLCFDLENVLPALLHVEDRVSMAHGLESRVPLINHKLIEYMSTVPEGLKVNAGNMKFLLKNSLGHVLPETVLHREDKMGFPVPINQWYKTKLKRFILELIINLKDRQLPYLNITDSHIHNLSNTGTFSRDIWMLINIELWYQKFFDTRLTYSGQ